MIAGPVVGGLLIDALSWRAVYWLELPCAAVVVALILRATPSGDGTAGASVDLAGAALAVPAVGGPVFYLIQAPRSGWGDPANLAALGAGVVSLAAFLRWEGRARNPLLPPALFRIRAFAALNAVTFVLYGALISCGTYTILFLQENLGYGPAPAGIAGAVPIVVLFVLSGRFGALADRYGGRPFIAGGLAVLAGALAWAGYRDPKAPAYDAARTLGCPITGARDLTEAPPIGSRTEQPVG